ncbi:putative bifunctional diguanylate cyclase/phosphodiesterase [Amphibiibacter pelophylacis]|uniref:EAL domain-containing protein n=1 Tax=Amphibiibacter pelophylacis TaxID=1799477 RepID=A0ACC6NZP4_9BURK
MNTPSSSFVLRLLSQPLWLGCAVALSVLAGFMALLLWPALAAGQATAWGLAATAVLATLMLAGGLALLRLRNAGGQDGLSLDQALSLLRFDLSLQLDSLGRVTAVQAHPRPPGPLDTSVLAEAHPLALDALARVLRQAGLERGLQPASHVALRVLMQQAALEGQSHAPKLLMAVQHEALDSATQMPQQDMDSEGSSRFDRRRSTPLHGEFSHTEIALGAPQIGGDKRWFEVKVLRRQDSQGRLLGFWMGCTDVTERHAAEESQRLISLVFERAGEGIVVTDAARRVIQINQAFSEVTGYTPDEVMGQHVSDYLTDINQPHVLTQIWYAIDVHGRWRGELVSRRKNGDVYTKLLSVVPLRDDDQRIIHYVGIFSEISELKQAKSELVYQSYHDMLTGLPNRRKLREVLVHGLAIRKSTQHLMALLVIDIDDFKDINDSHTHRQGDALLASTAHSLECTLRDGDSLYRLGGDEFAILLERLDSADDAAAVAHRIQRLFEHPVPLEDDVEVMVRISIGIVVGPAQGDTPEEMMQHADTALHRAKSEGKNRLAFYSENLTKAAKLRLALDRSIRRALENREFVLHYQPQMSLHDDRPTGVEALVRWKDPTRASLVYPDEFIGEAERTGLVVALGTQVLEMACQQGRAWLDEGLPLHMAVNVSARQLRSPNFIQVVADTLERTGFPAGLLEIEITESTLIGDTEKTLAVLMMLRDLGVSLAVDDFGTGYSSLSYLQRFPLTKLKIDRSFVNQLPDVGAGCAISEAVVKLSHSLGMTVQAEGVETVRQLEALRAMQCEFYQGYYASRPMPPDALRAWVLERGLSETIKAPEEEISPPGWGPALTGA